MLSKVWAVCTTKKGKTRRENRREMGGKWLLLRSHAVSKPTLFCQEMRSMRACRQRRSLPVFQTPHHVLSKKNFFFPCLCTTTQKSSSASNFAWTFFVFTKASGSWEQRRNLFRFSYENLWCLTFLRLWHCTSFWWKVWGSCEVIRTVKTVEQRTQSLSGVC